MAVVLVFGPDEGQVREIADTICRAILGGGDDPFRLAHLTGAAVSEDPARLADEAAALSMIGGRRVIRVRDVGDSLAKPLGYVLQAKPGGGLIVIEAGDLAKASKLRKLAEDAPNAVAIACYADDPQVVANLIRETMAAHRITLGADAGQYLAENLGSDRGITRQELEKLVLYAGSGGRLGFDEVVALTGDSSALVLDDLLYDSLEGKAGAVDRALDRLFGEGESPIGILRAAQRLVQRVHATGLRIASGESAEVAIGRLRPPVFYKHRARFAAALSVWTAPRAARLLVRLGEAEVQCKTTGFPEQVICRRVLSLARPPGKR
jgi:DNA polymerase-3 subunit delta